MVHLHFPITFTAEENILKKKYEKLKQKKKALENLNAPKQTPPPPISLVRAVPQEAKKDATEVAKLLLRTGAIKAIEVENKERQGFKRPKAAERKRNACAKSTSSVAGYQPFTASHYIEEEGSSKSSPSYSEQPPLKKLCETFVSAGVLEDKVKDCQQRELDRNISPESPGQGSTIYVKGLGVTQEILQKIFEPIGNILNISMEIDKNCGFVTFEKIKQAERAFKEINDTSPNGIHLSISLSSRHPLIQPLGEDSPSTSRASLAINFPQKGKHEDSRELVVYSEI